MSGFDRSNSEKSVWKGAAAFIAALFFFSAFFVLIEADHDCCGAGCPICACIHQYENLLRLFGSSLLPAVVQLSGLVLFVLSRTQTVLFFASITPVSQKVRLND